MRGGVTERLHARSCAFRPGPPGGLVAALRAGRCSKQGWAAPKWLQHPNIELRIPKKEGVLATIRKLHHKLMVIDNRIVVAGSFNYTAPANEYNDENLFVIGSPMRRSKGSRLRSTPCATSRPTCEPRLNGSTR